MTQGWKIQILRMGILALLLAVPGFAIDPMGVEQKVQSDLDSALSRLLPREQFLVQVNAVATTKIERRIVEGESFASNSAKENNPYVPPMPGFFPEVEAPPPKDPVQNRSIYRVVETPVLAELKVRVTFDDSVEATTVSRGKDLVNGYLRQNYANVSSVAYFAFPMLKPPKKDLAEEDRPKKEKNKEEGEDRKLASLEPKSPLDPYRDYVLVGILVALIFMSILMVLNIFFPRVKVARTAAAGGGGAGFSPFQLPWGGWGGGGRSEGPREMDEDARTAAASKEVQPVVRAKLLDLFLTQPGAFRQYFLRLTPEDKGNLADALSGPAWESLLENLKIPLSSTNQGTGAPANETISFHEKNFVEFSRTKQWENRQFFGFLADLTEEQIVGLLCRERPIRIAMVLRFLKPSQSAYLLDSLSKELRLEVLSVAEAAKMAPWGELSNLEQELRNLVSRVPLKSSGGDDVGFWGQVLGESLDQDSLFHDLEVTNAGISPQLKKYKFKLEDAGALPDGILEQVLSEVDNEELGLALLTVPETIRDAILGAVSEKRQQVVAHQINSYKNAPREQKIRARLDLTKRIREAMK